MNGTTARNTAWRLKERGFAPVPIPYKSKNPGFEGWPSYRMSEPEDFPNERSNIGVILGQPSGGLVVPDLDDEIAVALASQYLPPTGMIAGRKNGGKTHYFYRVAVEFKKREFKHRATEQKFIEILGDGQQVVVGPSVHPSGDIYDNLEGEPAEIDADELIDAVGRLYEAVCDAKGLDPYEGMPVDQPPRQPQPQRQQHGDATRPGDDYNERGDVRDLLKKHGWKPGKVSGNREHWTRPGKQFGTSGTLTDGKVFFVFSSSTGLDSDRGYGPFSLFCRLEHNGDVTSAVKDLASQGFGHKANGVNIDAIIAAPVPAPLPKPIIPADLLNPGGLLQQIIDFNLRTAIKPQPELALAGAIPLVGTLIGRKVEDDYNTRTNIYTIGLGGSGSGKDQARKVSKLTLAEAGGDLMFQDDMASAAGLHVALNISPSLLVQWDEFGRVMATMGNPGKHPWLYAILTVLLKLYSSSGSIYKGPVYADPKKNIVVPYPCVSMYATTVPGSFFAALTSECTSDGSLNRMLVFEAANNDPEPQEPEPFELPDLLRETARWWLQHNPGELINNIAPTPRRLISTIEAKGIFRDLSDFVRQQQRDEESNGTQIWGRCYENARKLALIHQCSLDHYATSISGASASWGCRLAQTLTSRIDQLAAEHIADGEFDALSKKLLRFIREAGNDGRTRTEVCRHMRAQNNRQLDEIVQKLEQTEELVAGPRTTAGRAVTVYKAIG